MEEQIMKKIFRIMAVLATVAAFAASCSKADIEGPDNGQTNEGRYDGPVKTLTFEASIGEPQTKTSLGEVNPGTGKYPVVWEAGDKVDVYWMTGETQQSSTGEIELDKETGRAGLTVKVPADLSEETVFYAVYPSGTETSLTPSDGEIKVTIPQVTGTFKSANIMVAKGMLIEDVRILSFKHACSILQFKTGDHDFNGGKSVKTIGLYNGHRGFVLGEVSCAFDDNADMEIVKKADKARYAVASNVAPGSECFVAIYPDYEFTDGFVASYYEEQLAAYTDQSFTVSRGEILNLGNIQDRLDNHRHFYFKPDGNGDASSWENAGSIAKFREILTEKSDEGQAYMQRMKLDNTFYHFMEGEYTLADDNGKRFDLKYTIAPRGVSTPLNIIGGYSQANPAIRDPKLYRTVFTGKEQYCILAVRDRVVLTVDGIVFEDACVSAGNRGGLYGAALYLGLLTSGNAEPEVHVRNCQFIHNIQQVEINKSYDGGAAINVRYGSVNVDDCVFRGNVGASRAGTIRLATGAKRAFFNDCLFEDNYTTSGFGQVVWAAADVTTLFGMNNCTFTNNAPQDAKGATGTVVLQHSPFILTNNTFVESTTNHSNDQGILRIPEPASSEGVYSNNIIVETSGERSAVYMKWKENGNYKLQSKGYNYISTYTTAGTTDGNENISSDYDKTGVSVNDFSEWAYSDAGYYTWNGNLDSYIQSTEMVQTVKANSLIGDDFYDWLVEIGAIVNDQFTDCRGWLRPAESMCPGAYDPNATAPAL